MVPIIVKTAALIVRIITNHAKSFKMQNSPEFSDQIVKKNSKECVGEHYSKTINYEIKKLTKNKTTF